MVKARLSLVLVLALVLHASAALGEPLSRKRSPAYYLVHSGATASGFALTRFAERAFGNHGPGPAWGRYSFYPDDVVQLNFSQDAASASDRTLALAVLSPLLVQMSAGFETSMANASLVYAETQMISYFVTSTTKLIARRPRPYTHATEPRIQEFADSEGGDAYASFFSGHASAAFTAATAGSLLYSARTDELLARHTLWGLEFVLAGMTAQLRVRAGRHYRTDIWVGSAVGIGIGALIPILHQVDVSRVRGSELGVAAGATALTMVVSEFVQFCDLLNLLGACNFERNVTLPVATSDDREARLRYLVAPAAYAGGGGLQLLGQF